MAKESEKTWNLWSEQEKDLIRNGHGIDIGCGNSPIHPSCRKFDLEDGDANEIGEYVHEQFDYVFSSHCLEHMKDPFHALHEWWKLVRPGGVMIVIVPDEDLYEQGVFPSQFNSDHKWTFTISKRKSWSPRSVNVLDLVKSLPDAAAADVELQDDGYDRSLLCFRKLNFINRCFRSLKYRFFCRCNIQKRFPVFGAWCARQLSHFTSLDQTLTGAMAQIQMTVYKAKHT